MVLVRLLKILKNSIPDPNIFYYLSSVFLTAGIVFLVSGYIIYFTLYPAGKIYLMQDSGSIDIFIFHSIYDWKTCFFFTQFCRE